MLWLHILMWEVWSETSIGHYCFTMGEYLPVPRVEGNGILATQVSNQDTAVLLHYP
jgi:hypothetical protein